MTATAARPNKRLITANHQRFDAMGLNAPAKSPLQAPTMDSLAAGGGNFTRDAACGAR